MRRKQGLGNKVILIYLFNTFWKQFYSKMYLYTKMLYNFPLDGYIYLQLYIFFSSFERVG